MVTGGDQEPWWPSNQKSSSQQQSSQHSHFSAGLGGRRGVDSGGGEPERLMIYCQLWLK